MTSDPYGIPKENTGEKAPRFLRAHTFLGQDVFNHHGEVLGEIKDLLLDMMNGRIRFIILSVGGFLGIGETLFPVPWKALRLEPGGKRFILNVDKDFFKLAPGFEKGDRPDLFDESWPEEIDTYYGMQEPHPSLPAANSQILPLD